MDFLCHRKEFFKNPNKLPLTELQLEIQLCKKIGKVPQDKDLEKLKDALPKFYNFKSEKAPALDPCWIQKERSFNKYQPYCSEVSKQENDLFVPRNKLFLNDLKFLLRRSYHQFWNYLIFEPRVGAILDSFMLNPVPWYEMKHLDGEFLDLYADIYDRIARIYLRMLTFKESDTEFMSEASVLRYLEENRLITCPKIMTLCLLYHKTCQNLINRLIDLRFCDAKFTKELKTILDHTLLVFEMVGGQVCGFEDNSVVIPIAIRQRPQKFDPYWVEEVATYLLDASATLNAFLSNCKAGVEMGFKMGIPFRLSYFYNQVYPALYEMLQNRADLPYNWHELKTRIYDHIGLGRSEFVNTFHVFVTNLIDDIIQTLGDNEKQDEFLERYLKIITTSLEDEFFIADYHNAHPVDVQILTITDFYPNLDATRTNYILECLSTLPSRQNVDKSQQPDLDVNVQAVATSSKDWSGLDNVAVQKVDKKKPTPTELEEMVRSVLDALPHLGDGFVLKCLEALDYNPVKIISSILDENLPSFLNELPRDLIRIPPEPEPEQPILAYRGKKPTYKDASVLLDDKSDMQGIKDYISKISSQDLYDDEYDDRDAEDSALHLYDRNDEVSIYKHMGNRFEGYELVSDPSDSSSEEERPVENAGRARGDFCEDPAVVRARYEANRKQHNSKGKKADVVGQPKGHGQDKSVTQSRDKKAVHKSSRANHNRKSGSQWKRNKGMIPM